MRSQLRQTDQRRFPLVLGAREYAFRQPGLARKVRISTNPDYDEQNARNVELWSPGNPTFPLLALEPEAVPVDPLADLLQHIKNFYPPYTGKSSTSSFP